MSDGVAVRVDQERCIGSGMCELLEAEVFLLDDDTNLAAVIDGATLPQDRALIVIDRCPAGAISSVKDGEE